MMAALSGNARGLRPVRRFTANFHATGVAAIGAVFSRIIRLRVRCFAALVMFASSASGMCRISVVDAAHAA